VLAEPGKAAAALRKLHDHDALKTGPVGILYGDGRGEETELAGAVAGLAEATGARVMPLYRATNERGALALGVGGWDSLEGVEALLSWGPPPAAGLPDGVSFVGAWDYLPRPEHERADVVLAGTSFAEQEGSYTNLEGRVQFLRPPLAVEPPGRHGWEVLAELAGQLGLPLAYSGVFEIQRAIAAAHPELAAIGEPPAPDPPPQPVLLGAARP